MQFPVHTQCLQFTTVCSIFTFMRIIQLSQAVSPPRFLRIEVHRQPFDILLHQPTQWPMLTGSFGREFGMSSYFIWFCGAGTGHFRLGKERHPFGKATLALADPGTPLAIEEKNGRDIRSSCVGFTMAGPDGKHLKWPFHELLGAWSGEPLTALPSPIILSGKPARDITRLLADYRNTMTPRGMFHVFAAYKAMLEIFCFLVQTVYAPDAEDGLRSHPPLMRVRIKIERFYDQALSLGELATIASMSPKYLCRAFRKAFGTTPMAYQQELRLREAQRLLSVSDMSVSEIATNVGFQSVFHFSRLFHKRVGCSPTSYASAQTP